MTTYGFTKITKPSQMYRQHSPYLYPYLEFAFEYKFSQVRIITPPIYSTIITCARKNVDTTINHAQDRDQGMKIKTSKEIETLPPRSLY
jgi:hypothetical protein